MFFCVSDFTMMLLTNVKQGSLISQNIGVVKTKIAVTRIVFVQNFKAIFQVSWSLEQKSVSGHKKPSMQKFCLKCMEL